MSLGPPLKARTHTSLGGGLVSFAVGIAIIPEEAALLMLSWQWFVLRAFPTLPNLSFLSAVGLSCFAGVIVLDASMSAAWASQQDISSVIKAFSRAAIIGLSILTTFLLHLIIGGGR